MTELEGQQVLAILFTAYAVETRNVSPAEAQAMVSVYRKGLADLDADIVARAIDQLTKSCERMPTIAAIRKVAVDLQHGARRPGGDAWGDVIAALRRYGLARSPGIDFHFTDPLVARAVEQLGWRELCTSHNAIADRARFIELYDEYMVTVRQQAQIAPGATHPALPRQNNQRTLGSTTVALALAAFIEKQSGAV